MTYKISFRNHIKLIYPCLISILVIGFMFYNVYFIYKLPFALVVWFIIFFLSNLRSLLYHLDYWLKNKNTIAEISDTTITYKNRDQIIKEPLSDIQKIEVFMPVFEHENWIRKG